MRNNTLSALIVHHGDSLLHRSGWPETVGVTQVAPGVVPGWLAVCGVLSADEILTLVTHLCRSLNYGRAQLLTASAQRLAGTPVRLHLYPVQVYPHPATEYAATAPLNVEESDRLSFLPYLFGDDFMIAEMQVYALARKMITGYEGGFWHFIRLPDGGGYMMPDCGPVHLTNSENWFDSTVSADAAGIILTSLAINRRLWAHHACGHAALTHLFRARDAQLWSHIEFHPECNAIYAALD